MLVSEALAHQEDALRTMERMLKSVTSWAWCTEAATGAVSVPIFDWMVTWNVFQMMIFAVVKEFGHAVQGFAADRICEVFEQNAKADWGWLKLIPVARSVAGGAIMAVKARGPVEDLRQI
jgi:uncharacterized protein (DUF697 family)